MVVHAKSNRKISYGDIAKTATVPNPLPEVTKADLKPASQFRLIGRDAGRVDVPSKVNGTAQYGIDVQLPGMLYAAVLFPQSSTRRPEQIDDTAAKAVKGVVKIVPLPSGVGVIAETIDAAMQGQGLAQGHLVEIDAGAKLRRRPRAAGLSRHRRRLEPAGRRDGQCRRRRRGDQGRRARCSPPIIYPTTSRTCAWSR